MVKLILEISEDVQIEIEEYCINNGIGFGEYLTKLHKDSTKKEDDQSFGAVPPSIGAPKKRGRKPKVTEESLIAREKIEQENTI